MIQEHQVFLQQLQHQAEKQSKLHDIRFIPSQLDTITSLIGRYPWQVILALSGLSALVLKVIT